MKKYLIIGFDGYYPKGGLGNIVAHTDNERRAYRLVELMKERRLYDYCEVVKRDSFRPEETYRTEEVRELAKIALEDFPD